MTDQFDQNGAGQTRRSLIVNFGAAASALSLAQPLLAQPVPIKAGQRMVLGMLLFEGFQLLDVFGPLEMFGGLRDRVEMITLAERPGLATSSGGPAVRVDHTLADAPKLDILMIPGGGGTRHEVNNAPLVSTVKRLTEATPHVATICTGAAMLARTGLLDGRSATTNKRAFSWASSQGPQVKWVRQARWVEDGKYFTSSGISAGMDMSLALIAKLFGLDVAERIANGAEYRWSRDATDDPFARLNGLVE